MTKHQEPFLYTETVKPFMCESLPAPPWLWLSLTVVVSVVFHDITEIFMTSASKSRQMHSEHGFGRFHSFDLKFIARCLFLCICAVIYDMDLLETWTIFDSLAFVVYLLIFCCASWQSYINLPVKYSINHPDSTRHSCLFAMEMLQTELISRVCCFSTHHRVLMQKTAGRVHKITYDCKSLSCFCLNSHFRNLKIWTQMYFP